MKKLSLIAIGFFALIFNVSAQETKQIPKEALKGKVNTVEQTIPEAIKVKKAPIKKEYKENKELPAQASDKAVEATDKAEVKKEGKKMRKAERMETGKGKGKGKGKSRGHHKHDHDMKNDGTSAKDKGVEKMEKAAKQKQQEIKKDMPNDGKKAN